MAGYFLEHFLAFDFVDQGFAGTAEEKFSTDIDIVSGMMGAVNFDDGFRLLEHLYHSLIRYTDRIGLDVIVAVGLRPVRLLVREQSGLGGGVG